MELLKDRQTQLAFIKARAEGKSYSKIQSELGIAKATCASWEQTLRGEIEALKGEQLEELYSSYQMTREARIKALGSILQDLDTAIQKKPLDALPADKLLELRLKYWQELKKEYVETGNPETDNTLDSLLEQYNQLYMDSRAGKYSPADVKAQLSILDAKKSALFQMALEQEKEETEGNPLQYYLNGYNSKVLRHDTGNS